MPSAPFAQPCPAADQGCDERGGDCGRSSRNAKGLRHAFGLHAIRCGVQLNLMQRWLGNASMATTAIYLQAMGNGELEIASCMWTEPPRVRRNR
jgi:site-specific recombinase XerC